MKGEEAGDGVRLFVGLAIPDEAAAELARRAVEAPVRWGAGARLMAAGDLHVTLRFLGEVEESRIGGVVEAMEAARGARAVLQMGGVGVFRGAGAVYAAVDRTGELVGMEERLSEALAWRGVARELREFRPHVTLARRRHGLPQEEMDRWGAEWAAMKVPAREMVLYRSVGGVVEGRRYARLHVVASG